MRLLAVLFLLTPYSTGQLGYMPMLFTSAGSYAYKLLVPLLLIDILVRMHKGQEIKKYWYLILFATFFVFDTAVLLSGSDLSIMDFFVKTFKRK